MNKAIATVSIITAVIMLVCLSTASLCAADSQPTDNIISKAGEKNTGAKKTSGLKGQIIFQSDRDDNVEVFRIDADGKNLKCLTDRDVPHSGVDFSPCGKYIAYKSPWDGYWNIYIMDADGGNMRQLTHSKSEDLNTRGGWKY